VDTAGFPSTSKRMVHRPCWSGIGAGDGTKISIQDPLSLWLLVNRRPAGEIFSARKAQALR